MHTHLGFPNTESNLIVVGTNPNSTNSSNSNSNNSNSTNQYPKKFKYKKQYRELKKQFEELECEYYDTQILYEESTTRVDELEEHCRQIEEQYNQLKENYNDFKNNFNYNMMEQGTSRYTFQDVNHLEETINSLTNQVNYIGQDYNIAIKELKAHEEELFKLREVNVSIEYDLNSEKRISSALRHKYEDLIIDRNKYQSQVAELTDEINDNIELQRKLTKLESENIVLENTNYNINQTNELLVDQVRNLKSMVKQNADNIMAHITKSRNTDKLIKQLREENSSLTKREIDTTDCILGYQTMIQELKQRLLEYKICEENVNEVSIQVSENDIENEYDTELEKWDICEMEDIIKLKNTENENDDEEDENDDNNEAGEEDNGEEDNGEEDNGEEDNGEEENGESTGEPITEL